MLSWHGFADVQPELASAGRALLYQYGVGLAFLATIRADGGPRTHPICPVIAEQGLFGFLVPSPKRNDLLRDARYAMHSFPAEENEDVFYLTGAARSADREPVRSAIESVFLEERGLERPPTDFERQELFEFAIERCLLTRTTGHGDPNPQHTLWRASPS